MSEIQIKPKLNIPRIENKISEQRRYFKINQFSTNNFENNEKTKHYCKALVLNVI